MAKKEVETTKRPLSKGALKEAEAQMSPKIYTYQGSNFEALSLMQMDNIINQLKEMNYYLHKMAGEPEYEVK